MNTADTSLTDQSGIVSKREKITLRENAEYGKLAFDQFVLSKWDYPKPGEQNQQQWDNLVTIWLKMDHIGRSPFEEATWPLEDAAPGDPRLPTLDQIDRVLKPHQTIQERNISRHTCVQPDGDHVIWLRTCYLPELAPAYEEMLSGRDPYDTGSDPELILDDASLYDYGENWCRILLRLPHIPDTGLYGGNPELEQETEHQTRNMDPPPENEAETPLWKASCEARCLIYLLDEEALRTKMLKVLWLDGAGNCVWHNTLEPLEQLNTFETVCGGLWEIHCFASDDPDLLHPGAPVVLA